MAPKIEFGTISSNYSALNICKVLSNILPVAFEMLLLMRASYLLNFQMEKRAERLSGLSETE